MTAGHEHGPFLCPTCQQHIPHARIDVIDVARAVEADKLTRRMCSSGRIWATARSRACSCSRVIRVPSGRTSIRPTTRSAMSSRAPAQVTVGGVTRPVKKGDVWVIPANTPHGGGFEDAPQVLFISSPIDDPDNQDRVWIDEAE